MSNFFSRTARFIQEDIWRVRIHTVPGSRGWLLRLLRVPQLAFREFAEDRCQLRASALTFYTLLSIVPVLAAAFGIAKGFGLQAGLRAFLAEQLRGQEEVLSWFLRFTDSLLQNARGGVVAGVGVALLLGAVIKLLSQIERAFNDVWGVQRGRGPARRFSDYLALLLVGPIFLTAAGSATIFLTGQVSGLIERLAWLGPLEKPVTMLLAFLPFVIVWFLLAFLYKFMPNTRVSLPAALIAGLTAGTMYQLAQWAYVYFQVGVSRYNAIYGGFAALPLFLVWLQVSWLIVLFGAEISFAVDNATTYEFEEESLGASHRLKTLLALRICELCVKRFNGQGGPLEAAEIARRLEAPVRLVRERLFDLVSAGVLTQVKAETGEEGEAYQPASDPGRLTIARVLQALETRGINAASPMLDPEELAVADRHLKALERQIQESPANLLLRDLPDETSDAPPREQGLPVRRAG